MYIYFHNHLDLIHCIKPMLATYPLMDWKSFWYSSSLRSTLKIIKYSYKRSISKTLKKKSQPLLEVTLILKSQMKIILKYWTIPLAFLEAFFQTTWKIHDYILVLPIRKVNMSSSGLMQFNIVRYVFIHKTLKTMRLRHQ